MGPTRPAPPHKSLIQSTKKPPPPPRPGSVCLRNMAAYIFVFFTSVAGFMSASLVPQ